LNKSTETVSELRKPSFDNDATEAPIIYFDGSCPLCTMEIEFYASRTKEDELKLVDVSIQGADLRPDLTAQDAMDRFHVRKPDGELVSGAKAFVEVWRVVPGWSWATQLTLIPMVLPMMEAFYRGFLFVRPGMSWGAARLGAKAANTPRQN